MGRIDPLPDSPRLARNNFDLLRLLFAGTVAMVHVYELSGYTELEWIPAVLSSPVAIRAFFVLSGFLVFMSFERSASLASYAGKRVRRIYPAYFTMVLLCALGLAAVSSLEAQRYFTREWLAYLAANLSFLNFLQLTLPGVFEANRLPTVNGALWTLKIEVMFYLCVPLFVALFRRFGRLRVLAITYCLSVAWVALFTLAAERTGSGIYPLLGRQLPGQLCYFVAGAFLYYGLPLFERHAPAFVGAAVAVLTFDAWLPLPALEPFALATVVVAAGLFPHLGNFGKYGDFSYGVYILHFPIIQVMIHAGWLDGHPWALLAAAVSTTLLAAFAMWHLVEKRFLLRSSHYVAATGPTGPTGGA